MRKTESTLDLLAEKVANLERENKKLQDENRKMRGDMRETDHTYQELSSELEDTRALLDEMETTGRSFVFGKAVYEKKAERCSEFHRYSYITENKWFGWELIKEFQYKDGDVRLTFQRNKASEFYPVWKSNEDIYGMMSSVVYALNRLFEDTKSLKATYKSVSRMNKYKLPGLKGLLNIRPKEQKKQIKRDVAEINNAYKAYNAEFKSTIAEIGEYEYKEKMRKELAADNTKLLSQTARILEVRKKYKIHCDEGHLSMNICHIAYSFDDKRLELGEDE